MKRFLEAKPPEGLQEDWPGQFRMFSWLDHVVTVPNAVQLITTLNPNGETSSLVFLSGGGHTHRNILERGEWAISYPGAALWERYAATIGLKEQEDELLAAGLTPLPSQTAAAPGVFQCPINVECHLDWHHPLGPGDVFCGRVLGAQVDVEALPAHPLGRMRSLRLMYNTRSTVDPGSLERHGSYTLGIIGEVMHPGSV